MKAVLKLLRECRRYLPHAYKTKGILIVGLILLSTFVDLFGIATVFPLFNVFLSDASFQNPFLKELYDFVGATDQRQFMFILMALVSLVLILKTVFITFSSFIQGRFIYSIYAHYVRQKYLSIFVSKGDLELNQNSDDLKSDLYILPRVFANQLLTALLNVIAETFVLVIVFIALLIYNWKIVSILLVTIVPLLMLFYYGIRKKNESVDVELKDYLSKISRSVTVAYFGNTDIKLSGTFDYFYNKFRRTIASESLLLNWKLLLTKIPALVVELIILFALIIMIVFNLIFDNSREQLILQISIFGVAAIKLMPSINRLMYAIMNIQANLYSIDILKERVDISDVVSSSTNINFDKAIEIKNADFSYDGRRKVFDAMTLTIKKGDRIGIIGESGSGKSTMLKLFLGHLKLQSGTFTVDGSVIDKNNLAAWYHKVGMVGQDVFILDDTLEANIAFGLETVDEHRLKSAIEFAALTPFVAALPRGVKTHLGEMGSLISGGQRQRIAIARALYHEAQLLLLDEATSSLDEKTEELILQSIQKLPPSLTVVAITHRMSFLGFCNKVFELRDGALKQIAV